jgi:predicted CXXCH cytochrome family protein
MGADDLIIDGPMRDHRLGRNGTVIGVLVLLLMVCLALAAMSMEDGEVRSSADGDNSYMDDAMYVGSGECADCHSGHGDTWYATPHAGAFGPATSATVVADWTATPTIEVADGVTVEPGFIENGTGFYMDLDGQGTDVYRVDYVQGAGKWLQVYLTEQGNSRYILPFAWANTVQAWVPFHTDMWFDAGGTPKMAPKDHVWDLQCVACHTVGAEVEYNDTSGEWTATWDEDGVACEACHGPGSIHKSPPSGEERTDYIWRTLDSALCGNCHVGNTAVGKVGGKTPGYPLSADGRTIRPGDDHDDFYTLTPQLHPDGETAVGQANQYNDYLTSRHAHSLTTLRNAEGKMDLCLMCHSTDYRLAEEGEEPTLETATQDIECALCHDMHGTAEENNLRLDKWDTCVQCHRNGDLGPGEDPLPSQKEVVTGDIPIDGLDGDAWMGGDVICTDCHMPDMGIREVAYDIPSHTFRFVSPEKSIDLGMPNSCTVSCHNGDGPGDVMTDEMALAYIEDKSALIEALIADAETAMANATDAVDSAEALGFMEAIMEAQNVTYDNAEFALAFIKRDASMVHNPSFQMEVLNYSIEKAEEVAAALEPGRVQGFVKDGDGKAVSGAEIRMDEKIWGTTSGDGSFDFSIAPGEHTFEVFKDAKKEKSFTVTVEAGSTADAGIVKFKKEESGYGASFVAMVALALILVAAVKTRLRDERTG